jgi:DNA invertase Pin-like site-specific DNA recombinase
VSTHSQNDDSRVDELAACGCDKIFTDTASGKLAARPELDKALACLREGDVLVITRVSRAMRSLKHLLALVDELRDAASAWSSSSSRSTPPPPGRAAGVPYPRRD